MPSVASQVYDKDTVPLNDKDLAELDGIPLSKRGLLAEAEEISKRRKPGRPKKGQVIEKIEKPKGKRGRPKNDPTVVIDPAEYEPDNKEIKITINFSFLREICRSQQQLFALIENLSSGNWKLASPQNGGVDLEYLYKLQERIRNAGLV